MHFEVTITNTEERFACTAEQTLLAAMERLGRKGIPVGCRNGGCGVCKVRVHAGSYRTAKMSRAVLTEHELASGCTLACKTYPQSAMAVQVTGAMARTVCAPRPCVPAFDFAFGRTASQPPQET